MGPAPLEQPGELGNWGISLSCPILTRNIRARGAAVAPQKWRRAFVRARRIRQRLFDAISVASLNVRLDNPSLAALPRPNPRASDSIASAAVRAAGISGPPAMRSVVAVSNSSAGSNAA